MEELIRRRPTQIFALVPALLALCLAMSARAGAAAAVRVDGGQVTGASEAGLTVYRAVPYAAPPVGALRWKPPQSPLPWQGLKRASMFAPACMQAGVSMPGESPPRVSEDCLYLNIWTPAKSARERLAVMVFVHGGGFANGAAAMPLYWGDRLARRGVVVVSFGYRLGVLGFLATSELSRESPNHVSGDYGILDQIAALKWVRRNIARFGGDPARVTLFGQSAGAMSISLLAATPLAKGLFSGAIGESGGVFEPLQLASDWTLKGAVAEGDSYQAALGAGSLADLRRLPADRLLAGKFAHPVIDGYVLPRSPFEAFANGLQNDVPTLIGSNADEARSLVDVSAVRSAAYEADIRRAWGSLPGALYLGYPHATDAQATLARLAFERDLRFGWDMWTWARLQAATGTKPVYYYHFTQRPPFPAGTVYAGWGASHYAELWYVFDHLDQEPWGWTAADRRLADALATYWTDFAKTGDPNGRRVPAWPRFRVGEGKVLYLGAPIQVGGVADLGGLESFDRVYDEVRRRPPTLW